MNIEKQAKRDFKQLNDFIEKAVKTKDYEFTWTYYCLYVRGNFRGDIIVDLGTSKRFNTLSVGEVDLVLRTLLKIYDLKQRELINDVIINPWTTYSPQIKRIDAFLKNWREYNDNDSFRMVLDNIVIESIDDAINVLLITIHHVIYTEGEYWTRKTTEEDNNMEDLSTDNVRIFSSIPAFCLRFWSDQGEFIKTGTSFKHMLFSKDLSTKYISIAGYNGNQINVTFHETPKVIELEDVMTIVRLMRTLLNVSYRGGDYGVDFNYKAYPDDMLSYIKDLLAHTPVHYIECVKKYDELEEDEDKYLYELYERAYTFLGKWLNYAENWHLHRQDQHSDNYYTDGNGQDMFAKFEALDDFREQTYALGFCYHNIEKYLVRAGRKTDDPTEDINKALDYLHEYRKLQKIYFE